MFVLNYFCSRIVPAFLIIMMFYALIMPTFSDGPLWTFRAELESRRCRDNWWLNLLFLNNYIHSDDQARNIIKTKIPLDVSQK